MSAQRVSLTAEKRSTLGRKVSVLRKGGKIPANIYGKGVTSTALTLDKKGFLKLFASAGETTLLDLTIEGESTAHPVLIRAVSYHPVSDEILHVDFEQVNLKQKVTANIPVEVVGESQAIKDGAVLVVVYNEIEVQALPTDLPEKFVIDIAKLVKVGDDVKFSDLVFDRSLVSTELSPDEVLATLQAQKEEVVEEVVAAEPAEVELTKQGATKEVVEGDGAAPEAKPQKEEQK